MLIAELFNFTPNVNDVKFLYRGVEFMIIGLTGGIASGKSTVIRFLNEFGASIIDADRISREQTAPGGEALLDIEKTFGSEYFYSDGSLNRSKLGKLIFNNSNAKEKLENILHPRIDRRIKQLTREKYNQNPGQPVIVDIPLLFEIEKQHEYDETWLVWVDYKTQLDRLINRDGFTLKDAENRIKAQIPLNEKVALADVVIDNTGTLKKTKTQVKYNYLSVVKKMRN